MSHDYQCIFDTSLCDSFIFTSSCLKIVSWIICKQKYTFLPTFPKDMWKESKSQMFRLY